MTAFQVLDNLFTLMTRCQGLFDHLIAMYNSFLTFLRKSMRKLVEKVANGEALQHTGTTNLKPSKNANECHCFEQSFSEHYYLCPFKRKNTSKRHYSSDCCLQWMERKPRSPGCGGALSLPHQTWEALVPFPVLRLTTCMVT